MPETGTLAAAFVTAAGILREAGLETPELDARLLLCHAAGLSHEALVAGAREALGPDAAVRLDGALARRLKREPVARITGMREFYGRRFALGPEALDPRPDTETLIEAALDVAVTKNWQTKPLNLLDLGTGTGCILVTLLAELPHARGLGIDLSPDAVALAAVNARRHGVASRAHFMAANWLDATAGPFDLVLSNPPYIATGEIVSLADEVGAYDPRLALDGGADGLEAYRRIAARARHVLADDGRLLVEIGPSQGEAVTEIFAAAGLDCDQTGGVRLDLAGRPRVLVAGVDLSCDSQAKKDLENGDISG
jgi:release factor glutamine methyltransferase